MNQFVKSDCACDAGYDKGALKKTIENNIFTIFGNLNQQNSIVIRYHGQLTERGGNEPTCFYMFYYFDGAENNKQVIKLQTCNKCTGECYCATINMEKNRSFDFGFYDDNNNYEINIDKPFTLEIAPDPISNIMQRYGFEQNTALPICEEAKESFFVIKSLFNRLKKFLNRMFDKY